MLGPERKAKPPLDLAVTRPTLPAREAFLPQERVALPVEAIRGSPGISSEPPNSPQAAASDGVAEEQIAAKQALAANLEDMIGGMLRNTQFATAATSKTRSWTRQIGEVAALDASTDESAFSANSLAADLAQARPASAAVVARRATPRRWWVDAILVLACVLSVLSAGYFTFAP